jgi:hypothetical protein
MDQSEKTMNQNKLWFSIAILILMFSGTGAHSSDSLSGSPGIASTDMTVYEYLSLTNTSQTEQFPSQAAQAMLKRSNYQYIETNPTLISDPTPDQAIISLAHIETKKKGKIFAYPDPNPKNEIVWFEWREALSNTIRVEIYDILGDRIETLYQYSPKQRVAWNIKNRVIGIVYYRIVYIQKRTEVPTPFKKIAVFR